jgi:5'-nucleotidase
LVTSRSAPAHDRAIRTLMSWDIEVDEAMFLGGLEKAPFLQVFDPDFYFDDQLMHLMSAERAGTPSGHVNTGVINAPEAAVVTGTAANVEPTEVNKLIRPRRTERA